MYDHLLPQIGSTWKHKKNGRIVRVTNVDGGNIAWESVTKMPGRNTGTRWCAYWTDIFTPHTEEDQS